MSKYFPLDWHKRRSGKEMSVKAELVLNALLLHNTPLYVMEFMKIAQNLGIGSMVSCHNALDWLRQQGFVKISLSDTDKRIKRVEITSKGKGYFA
jgi:DNA-binding MarR family transcriptional regulator